MLRIGPALLVATAAVGCTWAPPPPPITPQAGMARAILEVRWSKQLTPPPDLLDYKPQEFASAASDGKRVFIGSRAGIFYALRPGNGAVAWRRKIGPVSSRPLYLADSNTVFVGGDDGVLHALAAATGEERWSYATKGPIGGVPVYDDGLVYVANGENRVYAVDANSGAWRWQYEREVPESFSIRGVGAPLVYGGRVYAGFADGYLAALNARTGDVIWARSLAGDAQRFVDVDATPIVVGKTIYVSSFSGGVYALDPADGAVKWRFDVEGARGLRVTEDRVWFASSKAGIHCLDTEGRVVWRQALADQGELSMPLLVDGRYLLSTASEGGMFLVDAARGKILQYFNPGHGVSAEPSSDGRQLYVLTNSGFLYAFALSG